MRRHHALSAALVLVALAAPAAAHAEDVGTTTGGPLVAGPGPQKLPKLGTVAEGSTKVAKVVLRCRYEACSYTLAPRNGTAQWQTADFNPFEVQLVDLARDERRVVLVKLTALTDRVVEGPETFQLAVTTNVREADSPWLTREDLRPIRILDTTPHLVPSDRVDQTAKVCYSCLVTP